jgi:hypothetical protein
LETPGTQWHTSNNKDVTDVFVAEQDWEEFHKVMTSLKEAVITLPEKAAERLLTPDSYAAGRSTGPGHE